MKKTLNVVKSVLFAALLLIPAALPSIALAQSHDDDQSVKQDAKDAGHSTKEASKKTASKVKRGTKKVVSKSATKTAETADKVADKTKP